MKYPYGLVIGIEQFNALPNGTVLVRNNWKDSKIEVRKQGDRILGTEWDYCKETETWNSSKVNRQVTGNEITFSELIAINDSDDLEPRSYLYSI